MAKPDAPQGVTAVESNDHTTTTVSWPAPPGSDGSWTYELDLFPRRLHFANSGREFAIPAALIGSGADAEVRNVDPEGRSAPTTVHIDGAGPATLGGRGWRYASWAFWFLLLILALTFGALAIWTPAGAAHQAAYQRAWYSSALAVAVIFLALTPAHLADREFGVWGLVVGQDRRISTSKTQVALWTLLVGFMLVYLVSQTWFGHAQHVFDGFVPNGSNAGTGNVWGDYLIELGAPFAGLVIAKAAVTTKVQDGTLQKPAAQAGEASVSQVVTDDSGSVSLVDSQYLLFNLAALVYVIVGFGSRGAIPAIPSLLLALTGASAATYAGNKAIAQNAPVIQSISPLSQSPGNRVELTGMNLVPDGTTQPPTVTIGGAAALLNSGWSTSQLEVTVPADAAIGSAKVVVTTAAGAASAPQAMTVVDGDPVILSVEPPRAAPGADITVSGTGFYSGLDGGTIAMVNLDSDQRQVHEALSARLQTSRSGLDQLTVQIPPGVGFQRGDGVGVTVTTNRAKKSAGVSYVIGP